MQLESSENVPPQANKLKQAAAQIDKILRSPEKLAKSARKMISQLCRQPLAESNFLHNEGEFIECTTAESRSTRHSYSEAGRPLGVCLVRFGSQQSGMHQH